MPRSSQNGPSRTRPSSAERRLRHHLLSLSARGRHFRRVALAGPDVPAFRCLAARLVVVLAEPPHAPVPAALRALAAQGFRSLVFTRREVMLAFDRVAARIVAALEEEGEGEHDGLR